MAKVLIYHKEDCPFCVRAMNFLEQKGIDYDDVDLTGNEAGIQKIKDETGWKTVPIILIDGKVIGGYTDLKALEDDGKLDEMLK